MSLPFTGERYVPTETGIIRAEHMHRYALAKNVVQGAAVLDIACGEGFGCAMMAESATRVYGVDIDPESVAYASKTYGREGRTEFHVGSCDAIPLPDASVDIVTSFETLEHHDKHEEMMREVRRVLRPGGLLFISSPNKKVYSDEAGYQNPYHVKELYRNELEDLLSRHFLHTRIICQQPTAGSFVYETSTPLPWDEKHAGGQLILEHRDGSVHPYADDDSSRYYLGLCSDAPQRLEMSLSSAYMVPSDTWLTQLERSYAEAVADRDRQKEEAERQREYAGTLKAHIDHQDSEFAKVQKELRDALAEQQQKCAALEKEIQSFLPMRAFRGLRRLTRGSGDS
jgi:ubiquinone/menaquinone biosynthesis C-methylase UbiE